MSRRPVGTTLAILTLTGLLTACTSSPPPAPDTSASASSSAPSGKITVFAAASLTEAFNQIAKDFQAKYPGTTVTLNYGASSALATQIVQGAPADVFASASEKNMSTVVQAKAADSPATFARNVMEIAVPVNNPAHIRRLSDLTRPGVKVALCQSAVPCGATALKVFANAGLTVTPVTQEADVKATLAKVQLGEVDAGVVYVTDVKAVGSKVVGVPIPADVNASTSYPIAVTTAAADPTLAQQFVDYVLSDSGAVVLSADGFEKP